MTIEPANRPELMIPPSGKGFVGLLSVEVCPVFHVAVVVPAALEVSLNMLATVQFHGFCVVPLNVNVPLFTPRPTHPPKLPLPVTDAVTLAGLPTGGNGGETVALNDHVAHVMSGTVMYRPMTQPFRLATASPPRRAPLRRRHELR